MEIVGEQTMAEPALDDDHKEDSDLCNDEDTEKHDSRTSRQSNVSPIIDDAHEVDATPDSVLDSLEEIEVNDNESLLLIKERQKTFEKINRNMERNTAKWKRLQEQMSLTNLNDDSYSRLIDGRITEIRSMCCSVIRPEYILDSLDPKVRDYALTLVPVTRNDFEAQYRNSWTKIDLFRFGVRMVITYSKIARAHLKYPWWEESRSEEVKKEPHHSSNMTKFSINRVLRQSLTTNPVYRSNESIQQILWFNRAIGAFSDLFSSEMEKELARYISYETYDEDRVIRIQGDIPHKLYYILAGKIELMRVYRLSEGEVHKSMGFLTHKQLSDFECFETRTPSTTYLVARGCLEVLSLHREDYGTLAHQTNLESIRDFLGKMRIFKDMPLSPSTLESQLLKVQYYKHDKIITSNSQKDVFLYIVKSGQVAVVRQQSILNESSQDFLNSTDVYSLGCRRDGKHASDMLGLPRRQKNFKATLLEKSKTMDTEKSGQTKLKIKPQTMISKFVVEDIDVQDGPIPIVRSRTLFNPDTTSNSQITNIERKKVTEILSGVKSRSKQLRETYVKLDTLKQFDIFGLDSIEGSSSMSTDKLVLISEGAEVLLVNKRHFLETVNNNTLLEIRKLIKSYLSEEEAKVIIDDDTKWRAYKKVLMERMVSLKC